VLAHDREIRRARQKEEIPKLPMMAMNTIDSTTPGVTPSALIRLTVPGAGITASTRKKNPIT